MKYIDQTNELFFNNSELDLEKTKNIVTEALGKSDDGELFIELRKSEGLIWDDGRLKSASYDTTQGFGLRAIVGESRGYAHSGSLDIQSLKKAGETVKAVSNGYSGKYNVLKSNSTNSLYSSNDPVEGTSFEKKVKLLGEIDDFLRSKDNRVRQVSCSVSGSWQAIRIIRPDGYEGSDFRPMVRLNISVVVEEDGRRETGSAGSGGRVMFDSWLKSENWQKQANEALRLAVLGLESVPTPAGEMEVVLGPGWPGVMLHEAVGHGLEGDFNRKGTSVFSGKIGEKVASKGVNVVDDGTIPDRRGSITIDDEGIPSKKNILIEDGILRSYMQDRQNARLMGVNPTGNGRRESYACHVMPRMTNTFMTNGNYEPEEILKSVKKGIYAVNFGGGQVDITSGKFVFSASEAYLIENGKPTYPLKGATLIGNGPEAMNQISMIGNDLKLDEGVGTCGKEGQGVPVGVGQPTIRMSGITIGGTEV